MKRGKKEQLDARGKFELWQQREAGVSVKDCAAWHGISRTTVMRIMAEMRQKLGRIEKLPNERRARSHLGHPELNRQQN